MMRISSLFFFFLVFRICYAQEGIYDQEIRKRFVVEADPLCKRVKVGEPRRPYTPFFSRRYYLSIDGKENCQILDVWIQRLTDLADDNRREIYSTIYRFSAGAWVEEFGLDDKPVLRIKDKKTGIVYFVTELNEDIFYRKRIVYFSGDWVDKNRKRINAGIEPLGLCQNMPVFECRFIEAALERISSPDLRK
jgi:hypothetical protein